MTRDFWHGDGGALARYTRDLTADARSGQLEPVRCRDAEISRVVDILLRHGKNNPTLVGPSGVGKTAIAEGLAQRIAVGELPLSLRDARLLALDHMALLAGTMYRGQYEERLRAVVDEASAAHDVILFIDELHNLIGQGTAMGAAMDAANMLKPALVRGEFRVIGATTDAEYERWVCGDPALERRFQKVAVRELGSEETLAILASRKERLERHHAVVIADDALSAAVALTDAHITDRHRPDRAIDALDEACAHAHAAAVYSARTAELIRLRRARLRDARQRRRPADPATAHAPEIGDADGAESLDALARRGIAVIERFGAELEAVLASASPVRDVVSRPVEPAADHATTAAPLPPMGEIEVELQRRLLDEGVVVRAHDVARVVAVATGHDVSWTA
ncbi:MAG: hypothetical protein NVS1B4_18890 [Gemmatimonadaceae bacterium]